MVLTASLCDALFEGSFDKLDYQLFYVVSLVLSKNLISTQSIFPPPFSLHMEGNLTFFVAQRVHFVNLQVHSFWILQAFNCKFEVK